MTEFQILKGVRDSIYCWIIFIFESMDKYIIDNWVSCTGSSSVKQCCIFKFYKFYIPSYTKFAFLYSVFLFCSKVDKSRVTFQYLNRNRFIHNQTVKVEC